MRLILIHPPSYHDKDMFKESSESVSTAPWVIFKRSLQSRGFIVETTYNYPNQINRADWVLFMNVPDTFFIKKLHLKDRIKFLVKSSLNTCGYALNPWKILLKANRINHAALFLWEPAVVMPENYLDSIHNNFSHIFTWDKRLVDLKGKYKEIFWPQAVPHDIGSGLLFSERKLLVNFSSNKFSNHPLELYSLRQSVIKHMERHQPADFEHFGPGWGNDYPLWQGVAPNKSLAYTKYKFGLCFENMHGIEGYVTEKIFDCMKAGVVPIYYGASNIADVVDANAFVDFRKFKSIDDLLLYINNVNVKQWMEMREAGRQYLISKQFERFLPDSFTNMIVNGLGL